MGSIKIDMSSDDLLEIIPAMKKELEASKLSTSKKSIAEKTINDFMKIISEWDGLSKIKSDNERTKTINKLGGIGLENDLSLEQLNQRIQLFFSTYLTSKESDRSSDFFECFSKGDPCLSGRFESLSKFATKQAIGVDLDKTVDPEKFLFLPATILSNLLLEILEEDEIEKEPTDSLSTTLATDLSSLSLSDTDSSVSTVIKESSDLSKLSESDQVDSLTTSSESESTKPSSEKITQENISSERIREYLLVHPDQRAQLIEGINSGSADHQTNFLAYLESRGIYKEDERVDWKILTKGLINSKTYFAEVYKLAWEMTKETL